MQTQDHFQEFIADPRRRRIYEREALAFDASELISSLMEDKGVNKVKLAELTGTSKSHITQLLSGSRNMTVHTLADLAFVLGHKVEMKATPLCAAWTWFEVLQSTPSSNLRDWKPAKQTAYRLCEKKGSGEAAEPETSPDDPFAALVA